MASSRRHVFMKPSTRPPESLTSASRRYQSTQASVGDTHELAKDMFELIDADSSGEITVHEMHAVVSDLLGLDLSVEDVFNVVQDIDEDGNGELDLEEFEVLLERFGIFEDLMHVP